MAKRKRAKEVGEQLSILKLIEEKEHVRNEIKGLLAIKQDKAIWRGIIATPPGSLLEKTLDAFKRYTDIPLEVPFFVTLSYVSAHLLRNDASISYLGKKIRPDLWTIVLADSGGGKTTSNDVLAEVTALEPMPDSASAAKFIDTLAEFNRSLWVRDEFGKFLSAMENLSHMTEIRDYLLQIYDGKRISRRTKKDSVIIDDPALTILGLTQIANFGQYVTADMMLDGFAQRFNYSIAKPDPERPMWMFPTYNYGAIVKAIGNGWQKLIETPLHHTYTISADGHEAFETSFRLLCKSHNIPGSFFRRVMWRGVKYALIYHILLGKSESEIDVNDMGWAGRLCHIHLQDVAEIIRLQGMSDLERKLERVEALRNKFRDEGKPFTARDVVRGVWGIKNTQEARGLMSLID
jgi:hypothetical protein